MSYDVIIAGASFAGLSMATRIRGKVLLIDRKSVGALPTSACATFYHVLKAMGCENSLLKVFHKVNWQTSYNSYIYKTFEPFCTFDYKGFCQNLFDRFEGEFLKAHIKGYKNGAVTTDRGTYSARVIIDCTGWRATLASSVKSDYVKGENLCFGLETVVPYEDDKLHFILDPHVIEQGYAWVFPIDKGARVGLGSITEDPHNLVDKLKDFTASLNVKMGDSLNGGFIPFRLRRAVVDKIFLVGDSAGQVFPLTAEGIRQCVYFGQKCADIVQKIIDDDILLEEGLRTYEIFVEKHKWLFDRLSLIQSLLFNSTPRRVELVSRLCCWYWPMQLIQRKYFTALEVKPLQARS